MKITSKQIARKIAIRNAIKARQEGTEDNTEITGKRKKAAEVSMNPALLDACLAAAGYDEHASIAA